MIQFKKNIILIALFAVCFGANAQQMFDFSNNSLRGGVGFSFGQAGSFTSYARLGLGANLLFKGFYMDYLYAGPAHRYADTKISDQKWDDNAMLCINTGYQIPIFKWLYLMPMVGYAQINEGVTDGSKLYNEPEDDYGYSDRFHPYEVTTRTHYFNFGGGLSIQPCDWFSINLIATRTAIYAGFSINVLAFVE